MWNILLSLAAFSTKKELITDSGLFPIRFKNEEYGELVVCMSREKSGEGDCKHIALGEEVTHALLRPCEKQDEHVHYQLWDSGCKPVYFTVSGRQSTNRCTEYECRYPDDIKFSIVVQDLHCISANTVVCSTALPNTSISLMLLIHFVFLSMYLFLF